jgi:galactose-6-phosphate isomerase
VTKEADFGIVVCGTGVGITISANKVKGIRAVLAGDVETARYARQFLNANVLGMGSRVTGIGLMEEIVDVFLQTEYQETKESSELIGKIDELVSNDEQIKDPHFFDEFLEKWKSGAYGGIE